jgi:hypothetical protein
MVGLFFTPSSVINLSPSDQSLTLTPMIGKIGPKISSSTKVPRDPSYCLTDTHAASRWIRLGTVDHVSGFLSLVKCFGMFVKVSGCVHIGRHFVFEERLRVGGWWEELL